MFFFGKLLGRGISSTSSHLFIFFITLWICNQDCAESTSAKEQVGEVVSAALSSLDNVPETAIIRTENHLIIEREISKPDASYVAVHFDSFLLLEDEELLIFNGRGEQQYILTGEGKPGSGGTFWAQHVKGSIMILQLWVPAGSDMSQPRFTIDQEAFGFPTAELGSSRNLAADENPVRRLFQTESTCGGDDRAQAKCYEQSHSDKYIQSRAVARLLIQGAWLCTGWLASNDDHLITNSHCIEDYSDALNTDYEFEAEAPDCSWPVGQTTAGVVYSGGVMLKSNIPLDYTVVKVYNNPSSQYPHFEFDESAKIADGNLFSTANQDLPIYIPQHPSGYDKQLAIYSSEADDVALGDSVCHILSFSSASCTAYGGYLELGYKCDTNGGSSGSPVVSSATNKIVGLHHCGGCENSGVPINEIYSEVCADSCTCGIWDCCADGSSGDPTTCPDGNEDPTSPPSPNDSCEGSCGTNAGTCWCDELCISYGDCCTDVCEHCGIDFMCGSVTDAPVDPTTASTDANINPTTAPTDAPVDPTTASTDAPVDPTTAPTDAPVDPSTAPTDVPVQPTTTSTPTSTLGDDGQCSLNGEGCASDADCCSNFCYEKGNGTKVCKKPPNDDKCKPVGEACQKGNQCCSGKCNKDGSGSKICFPLLRHRWA
jgi:V8-like Glu-specific endopeptidase